MQCQRHCSTSAADKTTRRTCKATLETWQSSLEDARSANCLRAKGGDQCSGQKIKTKVCQGALLATCQRGSCKLSSKEVLGRSKAKLPVLRAPARGKPTSQPPCFFLLSLASPFPITQLRVIAQVQNTGQHGQDQAAPCASWANGTISFRTRKAARDFSKPPQ